MKLAALVSLCLAAWWTFMILMVLLTAYYRRWRLGRRIRSQPELSASPLRCLLLRPCSGEDAEQLTCLTSIAEAKHDFSLEVIIGVDNEEDPAMRIAARAVEILLRKGIESSVQITPVIGPNSKVSILAGCQAAAKHTPDIIISADSNTDLTGFDLNRLVAPLSCSDDVAAIWVAPWVEATERGFGNLASEAVLHGSWHSFGLLGAIDPRGMVGKLFAITREALTRIGGFEEMVRFLGEDMEMSKRLRLSGYRVQRFQTSVRTTAKKTSWAQTVSRHARWIMVIKAQRRRLMTSYPLLFFNTPIVLSLAAFGMLYSATAGLLCLLAAVLLRLVVAYSAGRMLGLRPRTTQVLTHALIADVLLLVAFSRAVRMQTVHWRGKDLGFTSSGELVSVSRK